MATPVLGVSVRFRTAFVAFCRTSLLADRLCFLFLLLLLNRLPLKPMFLIFIALIIFILNIFLLASTIRSYMANDCSALSTVEGKELVLQCRYRDIWKDLWKRKHMKFQQNLLSGFTVIRVQTEFRYKTFLACRYISNKNLTIMIKLKY